MPDGTPVDHWPLTPADARTAADPLRGGSQRVREAWERGNEPGPNDGGTRPAAPGFTGSTLHQTTCIMQGASLLRLWTRPRRPTGGSAAGPSTSTSWPFERCKRRLSINSFAVTECRFPYQPPGHIRWASCGLAYHAGMAPARRSWERLRAGQASIDQSAKIDQSANRRSTEGAQ